MRHCLLFFICILGGDLLLATPTVGNISSSDVNRISTRREALHLVGGSFGPTGSQNMESDALYYGVSLTGHWETTEHGEVRLRGGADFAEDGRSFDVSASIGGAFFLFTHDVSPLVGADVGFGYAAGKGLSDALGFSGGVFAGVRLFRTSKAQLELLVRYHGLMAKNQNGRPAFYGMSVGLLI